MTLAAGIIGAQQELDSSDGNYRSMTASSRDSTLATCDLLETSKDSARRQELDSSGMKLAGSQLEEQRLGLRGLRACRGLPRSVRERVSSLVRAREERRVSRAEPSR